MDGTMMSYPLTLPHLLKRAATLYPSVEIVTRRPDRSIHRTSYGEIDRRARALAAALQKAGLERGDRVATLCWNHFVHLEAYFGIPMAGGILHTLNLRLHPDDIAYIATHAEDRIVIVDDVLLPLYEQFKDRIKAAKTVVVPFSGQPVPEGYEDYESFIAGAGELDPPDLDENEGAAMCYTSGTTGRPKGVIYSHRAMVLHSFAVALADTLAISQNDSILSVVPMFHANAWGLPYAATMMGAKQVFPGPHLDAESLLELFADEQVTMAGGVPTIWIGILQALDANPGKWKLAPGVRTAVGGSAAPESMIRAFDKHGIRILHAWGMTEMTPIGTIATLKAGLRERPENEKYAYRAKQGVAVPFVDLRVVGDDGVAPWDGETMGELQVRGPWIAASYYDFPDAGDRWSDDGWFKTGDVVTMDEEGYVKITDRTKDLIKSGGEWISSVDLENALMAHPAVREAAVIAIPHPKWTERPLACIVREDGKAVDEEELQAVLAKKFAKWWLPDGFAFVDEIPKTSVGKFRKTALRESFKDWRWDETREAG